MSSQKPPVLAMVWCELLVINNSSERVWETAWRDEGYEVKAVEGGDIDLSPGETQKNWMIPKKGFVTWRALAARPGER